MAQIRGLDGFTKSLDSQRAHAGGADFVQHAVPLVSRPADGRNRLLPLDV